MVVGHAEEESQEDEEVEEGGEEESVFEDLLTVLVLQFDEVLLVGGRGARAN